MSTQMIDFMFEHTLLRNTKRSDCIYLCRVLIILSGSVLFVNKNFFGKSNTAVFDCDEAFFDTVTMCQFFCLSLHYTWPAKYQASTWSLNGISYISTKQAPKIKSNATACRLSTIFVWAASTTCGCRPTWWNYVNAQHNLLSTTYKYNDRNGRNMPARQASANNLVKGFHIRKHQL